MELWGQVNPEWLETGQSAQSVERYPSERYTSYLAYQKRTNVTTKEERNHQQGWSDKPKTDSTMTAFSDPASELITSGTKEKKQTNTVGDSVLGMLATQH